MLAKVQQTLLDKGKVKIPKANSSQKPFRYNATKTDIKQSSPPMPMSKERQKRDFCKANNLCFYCCEPFDTAHLSKCTKRPRAQMNALVLNDLDVELNDEVLKQLEVDDTLAAEFCSLSLNAISGTATGDTLKLAAKVKNKVMLILVDSRSSHSFVSSTFLSKCGITPEQMPPQLVKLANGETMVTNQRVKDLSWWIQGHTITSDMMVLDMGAFDAILGYDWLQAHSPMNCHWEKKQLNFLCKMDL